MLFQCIVLTQSYSQLQNCNWHKFKYAQNNKTFRSYFSKYKDTKYILFGREIILII